MRLRRHPPQPVRQAAARKRGLRQVIGEGGIATKDHAHDELLLRNPSAQRNPSQLQKEGPGSLPALTLLSLSCPAYVPGIHVLLRADKVVDGRVKPGHDDPLRPHFSDARFGGEAGHDLISVS